MIFRTLLVIFVISIGITGCGRPDEIITHRIPKSRSDLDRFDRVPPMMQNRASSANSVPGRMVVGLIERSEATWFFKISGPVDQVNLSEPIWREFFANIEFDAAGKPKWDLPKEWTEGPSRSMRFATLNITDMSPPLELSISSLGPGQNLLANINRWRGQLGLKPTSETAMNLTKLKYTSGEMLLFDEAGMVASSSPPMSGGSRPSTPAPKDESPGFDTPAGWETGKTSSIVQVRLQKSEGDQKTQITVVEMPASANEWEPNVRRWVQELGIEALTDEEIKERTTDISIDGSSAQRIKLTEDDTQTRATIAVMAKRGESAWFFKLTGDPGLVRSSATEFRTFLDSFKFPK